MNEKRETDVLASFVHGSLAGLHGLGAVYNIRRGNTPQVIIHIGALLFDLWATYQHIKDVRNPE